MTRARLLLPALILLAMPAEVFAACTSPGGTAGDQFYNTSYNLMQYCNGTSWVNMGSSGTISGIGTLTNGDFCTTDGSVINCTTASISLTSQASGTLQAAQMLALTGDVTNSAGAVATTVGKINGVALGSTTATAGNLLIGSGTAWVANAVTGDITITSGGVTAIGSGKVTNAMLAGSIALSKLSVTGTPDGTKFLRDDGAWAAASSALSGGSAGYGAVWSSSSALTYDSALYVDTTNHRIGIGSTSPGSALDVKGTVRLSGSTSGYVGLAPAATAGSTTYTLPSADGSSGQMLSTNGSGTLSWASASGGAVTGQVSAFALSSCPSGWSSYSMDVSDKTSATLLLLHGEGANNSTTITDNGPLALTLTAAGNAKISTSQYKYGSGSMSFDGNSSTKITTPNNPYFSFKTNPFTIEFWMRAASVSDGLPLAVGADGGGIWIRILSGKPYLYVNSSGGYGNCGGTTMSTNTWYHLAVVSDGTNLYTFINGTLECTNSSLSPNVSTSTGVTIGGRSEGSGVAHFNGYIDDLRISNTARYTSSFTAPATAYSDAPIYCSKN